MKAYDWETHSPPSQVGGKHIVMVMACVCVCVCVGEGENETGVWWVVIVEGGRR
jgi:hypothetical protein